MTAGKELVRSTLEAVERTQLISSLSEDEGTEDEDEDEEEEGDGSEGELEADSIPVQQVSP